MGTHASGTKLSFPKTNDPAMGGYTRKVAITSPDAAAAAGANPTAAEFLVLVTLANEIKAKLNSAGHFTAAISAGGNDQANR